MKESVDIDTRSVATASYTRRNAALYSMIILLSVSTLFCVVKSVSLPADINDQLMRTENARIDKQLEKSLAEQKYAVSIHLQSPSIHKKGSVAASKQKQSKTAVATAIMQTQSESSVCEQDELKKLQANFRGGQWDE